MRRLPALVFLMVVGPPITAPMPPLLRSTLSLDPFAQSSPVKGQPAPTTIEGRIKSVEPASMTIVLDDDTRLVLGVGDTIGTAGLRPGMRVLATYRQEVDGQMVATSIIVRAGS